jgi:hypothetical protein
MNCLQGYIVFPFPKAVRWERGGLAKFAWDLKEPGTEVQLAFVRPQLINEETHISRAEWESEGSILKEGNIEIMSTSSQTSSQSNTNRRGIQKKLAQPKEATNQNSTLLWDDEKAIGQWKLRQI